MTGRRPGGQAAGREDARTAGQASSRTGRRNGRPGGQAVGREEGTDDRVGERPGGRNRLVGGRPGRRAAGRANVRTAGQASEQATRRSRGRTGERPGGCKNGHIASTARWVRDQHGRTGAGRSADVRVASMSLAHGEGGGGAWPARRPQRASTEKRENERRESMCSVYYKEVEWRGKETSIHSTALFCALRCGRQGPTSRHIA